MLTPEQIEAFKAAIQKRHMDPVTNEPKTVRCFNCKVNDWEKYAAGERHCPYNKRFVSDGFCRYEQGGKQA